MINSFPWARALAGLLLLLMLLVFLWYKGSTSERWFRTSGLQPLEEMSAEEALESHPLSFVQRLRCVTCANVGSQEPAVRTRKMVPDLLRLGGLLQTPTSLSKFVHKEDFTIMPPFPSSCTTSYLSSSFTAQILSSWKSWNVYFSTPPYSFYLLKLEFS